MGAMLRLRGLLALALIALASAPPAHAALENARTTGAAGASVNSLTRPGAANAAPSPPSAGASSLTSRTAAPSVTTTTPLVPSATAPAPTRPLALGGQPAGNRASTARHGERHISTLAIVIAALGALLVLACAAWALARARALEPHWWLAMRHSLAEAGYRMSVTWAEFIDWARLGH
jgi:hypothetical protein